MPSAAYTEKQRRYMIAFLNHIQKELTRQKESYITTLLNRVSTGVEGVSAVAILSAGIMAAPATLGVSLAATAAAVTLLQFGNKSQFLGSKEVPFFPDEARREAAHLDFEILFGEVASTLAMQYRYFIEAAATDEGVNNLARFAAEKTLTRWLELMEEESQVDLSALMETFTKICGPVTERIPVEKTYRSLHKLRRFEGYYPEGIYALPAVAYFDPDNGSWHGYGIPEGKARYGYRTTTSFTLPQKHVTISPNWPKLASTLSVEYLIDSSARRQKVEEYLNAVRRESFSGSLNTYLSKTYGENLGYPMNIIAACHDAALQGMNLSQGDFSEVNFRRADLQGCYVENTTWNEAHLEHTLWGGEDNTQMFSLDGSQFQSTHLEGSRWLNVNFSGARKFLHVSMKGALIKHCQLEGLTQIGCAWELIRIEDTQHGENFLQKLEEGSMELLQLKQQIENLSQVVTQQLTEDKTSIEALEVKQETNRQRIQTLNQRLMLLDQMRFFPGIQQQVDWNNLPMVDTHFQPRPELITAIEEQFFGAENKATLTMVGQGGNGKTRLAHAYARQHRAQYTNIRQLTMENEKQQQISIISWANALGIEAEEKDNKVLLDAIDKKIQGTWLIILDNVESYTTIKPLLQQLFDMVREPCQHILITTRNPDGFAAPLQVPGFTKTEALSYIEHQLNMNSQGNREKTYNESAAEMLCQFVDNHPLALELAMAAYCEPNNTQSFTMWVNMLQNDHLSPLFEVSTEQVSIELESQLGRTSAHTLSTLWDIALCYCPPEALKLLEAMSVFSSGGISEPFVAALLPEAAQRDLALAYCRQQSWIQHLNDSVNTRKIHGLLRLLVQHRWQIRCGENTAAILMDFDAWKNALLSAWPKRLAIPGDIARIQEGISHAQTLIAFYDKQLFSEENRQEAQHQRAGLLAAMGEGEIELAYYAQAKTALEEALTLFEGSTPEQTSGNQLKIAYTWNLLGKVYQEQGYFEEASERYQTALSIYQKIDESTAQPGIAEAHNSLGRIYYAQGLYQKAKEQYETALEIHNATCDENDNRSAIAGTLHNLGNVYTQEKNYEQALKQFQEALDIYIAVHRENTLHISIAETLCQMGNVYTQKYDYDQASEKFERALGIYMAVCGEKSNYPSIAETHNRFGYMHYAKGSYPEAQEHYETAYSIYETIYGETPAHPNIAGALCNLGNAYAKQGNYTIALEKFSKALDIYMAIHEGNPNHPSIAETSKSISTLHSRLMDYDNAPIYLENAQAVYTAITNEQKNDEIIQASMSTVQQPINTLNWRSIVFHTASPSLMALVSLLLARNSHGNSENSTLPLAAAAVSLFLFSHSTQRNPSNNWETLYTLFRHNHHPFVNRETADSTIGNSQQQNEDSTNTTTNSTSS